MKSAPIPSATLQTPSATRTFNWRLLFLLWGLLLVALITFVPYQMTLAAGMQSSSTSAGLMIHTPALVGVVINGLVFLPVLALGLFAAGRIGLGAPILDGWLRRQAVDQQARAIVKPALIVGLGLSTLLVLVAEFGFGPALETEIKQQHIVLVAGGHPPVWQGLLALFYGAFFEEQLIRLVLLSLMAWLGSLLFHTRDSRPVPAVLWVATILASIPFTVGHLPAAAAIGLPLDALIVTRTLALNLPLSIAFGWLYWKRGLESAMLAHFCADVLVVVVAPLVFANWIR